MTRPLAALLAAVVSVSSVAFAQDAGVDTCDDLPLQRPQETFPADRAPSVSIDAPLRIRYTPGYFGPTGPGGDPTRLLEVRRCTRSACDFFACDDTAEFVPGRVQVLDDGFTRFNPARNNPTASRRDRFLTLSPTQHAKALEAITQLTITPPLVTRQGMYSK